MPQLRLLLIHCLVLLKTEQERMTSSQFLMAQLWMDGCFWMFRMILSGIEPGRAEADFARFDAKTVVKNVYILLSRCEIPIAEENQEIMDMVSSSATLPPWLSNDDLELYGSLYVNFGFQTTLQVPYRCKLL